MEVGPVAEGAEVVSEVGGAGGLDAGEDYRFGGWRDGGGGGIVADGEGGGGAAGEGGENTG